MTHRKRHPDELDPLGAALNRYSAAFPWQRPPFLHGIGGHGGEALEVAVGMPHRAVAANGPLDPWAITAALGVRRPPDGPVR